MSSTHDDDVPSIGLLPSTANELIDGSGNPLSDQPKPVVVGGDDTESEEDEVDASAAELPPIKSRGGKLTVLNEPVATAPPTVADADGDDDDDGEDTSSAVYEDDAIKSPTTTVVADASVADAAAAEVQDEKSKPSSPLPPVIEMDEKSKSPPSAVDTAAMLAARQKVDPNGRFLLARFASMLSHRGKLLGDVCINQKDVEVVSHVVCTPYGEFAAQYATRKTKLSDMDLTIAALIMKGSIEPKHLVCVRTLTPKPGKAPAELVDVGDFYIYMCGILLYRRRVDDDPNSELEVFFYDFEEVFHSNKADAWKSTFWNLFANRYNGLNGAEKYGYFSKTLQESINSDNRRTVRISSDDGTRSDHVETGCYIPGPFQGWQKYNLFGIKRSDAVVSRDEEVYSWDDVCASALALSPAEFKATYEQTMVLPKRAAAAAAVAAPLAPKKSKAAAAASAVAPKKKSRKAAAAAAADDPFDSTAPVNPDAEEKDYSIDIPLALGQLLIEREKNDLRLSMTDAGVYQLVARFPANAVYKGFVSHDASSGEASLFRVECKRKRVVGVKASVANKKVKRVVPATAAAASSSSSSAAAAAASS